MEVAVYIGCGQRNGERGYGLQPVLVGEWARNSRVEARAFPGRPAKLWLQYPHPYSVRDSLFSSILASELRRKSQIQNKLAAEFRQHRAYGRATGLSRCAQCVDGTRRAIF